MFNVEPETECRLVQIGEQLGLLPEADDWVTADSSARRCRGDPASVVRVSGRPDTGLALSLGLRVVNESCTRWRHQARALCSSTRDSTLGGSGLKLPIELFTLQPTVVDQLRADSPLRYTEMVRDL